MIAAIAQRTQCVQVQAPQGQTLRVIPIVGPSHDAPEYRLLDQDTLALVKVTETSESGSVPQLLVQNGLDVRVLLIDGQELVGAKQNRILNTDVLVPAKATITIPVSCVEAGRWRHVSAAFVPGKSASYRTRSAKLARVHQALKSEGRHDADQSATWAEVDACLDVSGSYSGTAALSAAYENRQKELAEFRSSLALPENAVGVAVFRGAELLGLDLFDRHTTLKYFWESLIDSYMIEYLGEAMEPSEPPASEERQAVKAALDRAAAGNWEQFPSPGEGADYRLSDEALSGAALVWEDRTVVHMQLYPRRSEEQSQWRPRIRRPWVL